MEEALRLSAVFRGKTLKLQMASMTTGNLVNQSECRATLTWLAFAFFQGRRNRNGLQFSVSKGIQGTFVG